MIKRRKRQSKYFAPQNEHQAHCCDHPGCKEAGEYRAPKDRSLKSYYWFCLKHVQEYNAKWNYYEGLDPEEEEKGLSNVRNRAIKEAFKLGAGHIAFIDDDEIADINWHR